MTIFTNIFSNLHLGTKNENIDGFYIQKPENIFYLTGFAGSFSRLLIGKKKAFLVSDSRYSHGIEHSIGEQNSRLKFEYREISSDPDFWKNLEKDLAISHLAFEANHCTYAQHKNLQKIFVSPLVPSELCIEKIREIKSATEISLLLQAAKIADKTLEKTVQHFSEGISEKELAWIFEQEARKIENVQGISFETIVAFGKNSAVAHHHPTEKKLVKNMPILIDCGVKYKGYCSDMTRCFWFGDRSGKDFLEWEKIYKIVLRAQQQGVETMNSGENIANPDMVAKKVFGEYKKFFCHSFGHGVGVEIHESPGVGEKNMNAFQENMVVTAEPGLYFNGKFGIRIEDLLVIRKNGPQLLSRFPYEFPKFKD